MPASLPPFAPSSFPDSAQTAPPRTSRRRSARRTWAGLGVDLLLPSQGMIRGLAAARPLAAVGLPRAGWAPVPAPQAGALTPRLAAVLAAAEAPALAAPALAVVPAPAPSPSAADSPTGEPLEGGSSGGAAGRTGRYHRVARPQGRGPGGVAAVGAGRLRGDDVPGVVSVNVPLRSGAPPQLKDLAATAYAFARIAPLPGGQGRPLLLSP